jgi:DNA-directed RNA polymerase specialized sigma24 family protein
MLTLDAEDRRLCERFYHGGWPTARLATEMKIGEAAVRKRLQRLRT